MTDINNYPNYLIYTDGRIYSKYSNRFIKPYPNKRGYLGVGLCKNGKRKMFRLNRLVALQFIPNPENKSDVDHINDIKTDNRVENLQWLTQQENLDKRITVTNTGYKYITKRKDNRYSIEKHNCFREYLSCSNYTLEDAVMLRDSLLSMED